LLFAYHLAKVLPGGDTDEDEMPNALVTTFPPSYAQVQLQFANILLNVNGVPFQAFPEIEYSDNVDVEEGKGASPYSMGRTVGQYKAQGSISVQLRERDRFLSLVSQLSPDGNSIYDAFFPIQVSWQIRTGPNIPPTPPLMDELSFCSLGGAGVTGSTGPGVMVCKFPLHVGLIRWSGKTPLAGLPL
jgi:hypothetical protein